MQFSRAELILLGHALEQLAEHQSYAWCNTTFAPFHKLFTPKEQAELLEGANATLGRLCPSNEPSVRFENVYDSEWTDMLIEKVKQMVEED